MKKTVMVAMVALAVSAAVLAGNGRCGGSDVDLATLRNMSGTVESVAMDYGLGYPGFVMATDDGTTLDVHLGPYWFLVSKNFSLAVGDEVSAEVADCTKTADEGDVVAFEVTDSTSGAYLALRDDSGVPFWSGRYRHGGLGQGTRHGQESGGRHRGAHGTGPHIDLFTLVEKVGTVTATNLGVGTHSNFLEFDCAGESFTLFLGPFWYMSNSGFTVKAGDSIKAEMAQCANGWTAFSLTNLTTGTSIEFRDENGIPLWLD